ncbi:c-type cytochrome biogenesis protein CcsB [Niveibacterium sp.]|uniref:c-type cytochrome biogenesis protein CcsB n=1 Tax=Niveibacterium sp. TaxID=2017444 RepID=UPI0035B0FAC9
MTDLAQSISTPPRQRPIAPGDWLAALALALGAAFALREYGSYMDVYEKAILLLTVPALALLGWHWHGLRNLLAAAAGAALLGIGLYQNDLARAEQVFWLKYFFSSQTAIAWMSALVFFSTGAFWLGLLARAPFAERVGTALSWVAAGAGLTGLLVRWYESYLIGPDVGHIPVSNLYEVFVLFIILTTLLYLYYARHYATNRLGAFVLPVVAAAVGFLLWYSFSRDAHEIQPLIPALQSYWMKIHVPANFVGYGAFALASMVGVAYLCASRGVLASRLPSIELLDDLMYRAIGIGFAFFTVATILGALWAAEAWGTYWQWDPKETWALIVWLNYAAWLHMRLTKGLRGAVLAWWAIIGLLVTSFAFLGVNMFLSGLHSYGSL